MIPESASMLIGCAVVLVARSSFADRYQVPSGTMLPTLCSGDRIVVG